MSFNFVGEERIIYVPEGTTQVNVVDLYAEWKIWAREGDNLKFPSAMKSIGGEEIAPGKYIAAYIELLNGWRIKPYDGDYVLTVVGNLFVNGGLNPFLQADDGNVLINMVSSSNALSLETSDGNCDIGIGFI